MKKLLAAAAVAVGLANAPTAQAVPTGWDADDHPALVAEFTGAVDVVAARYPEIGHVRISSEPISGVGYARAIVSGNMAVIEVNEMYASDPAYVAREYGLDIQGGFHPPLGHCTPAQALAYHEAGHVVEFVRGNRAAARLVATFPTPGHLAPYVSDYSLFSPQEAVAEAFAAYMCGSANPTEAMIASWL